MIHFCSLSSGSKCIRSLFHINLGFLFNLLRILWGKNPHFINCALETMANKPQEIPIQRTSEELMRRRCHKMRELEGCGRGFPVQKRLPSPLSPNFLEKQFWDGYEKNNRIYRARFHQLETAFPISSRKGRRKGKRLKCHPAEHRTSWGIPHWRVPACFGREGQKSLSLAEKSWRALRQQEIPSFEGN